MSDYNIVNNIKFIIKQVVKYCLRTHGIFSTFPFRFKPNRISYPENVSHSDWVDFLVEHFNKKNVRILEIGSRNVTGTNLRLKFSQANYVGFDFYAGENVDIVGDAHKLSSYFDDHTKFDLIFSSAVFEHLYMPWVVAIEIQKMLKVGGFVFIETHFSFSSHERPWNFFQFSDVGLRVLFNDSLGFDLIDSGMSNPISGHFNHNASRYLRYLPVLDLYCHSEILCKKRCEVSNFEWGQVSMNGVVGEARYPMANSLRANPLVSPVDCATGMVNNEPAQVRL